MRRLVLLPVLCLASCSGFLDAIAPTADHAEQIARTIEQTGQAAGAVWPVWGGILSGIGTGAAAYFRIMWRRNQDRKLRGEAVKGPAVPPPNLPH